MLTPATTIPGKIPWIQSGEFARGFDVTDSPYPLDIDNRALKWVLKSSGYDPDASTFQGLPGPVFNILAYGADKSGASSSQQALIDATAAALAVGGGYVLVPPGTFRGITKVPSFSNITYHGFGNSSQLIADDSSTEDYLLEAIGLSNFHVKDLLVDVNGLARNSYTGAMGGIIINGGTDCGVEGVYAKGSLGSSIGASAVLVVVTGNAVRPKVKRCILLNAGTLSRPSDGVFMRAIDGVIDDIQGDTGYDTLWVLEGSIRCKASNTRAKSFASFGAITNDGASDCYGNSAEDIQGYDWNGATGGFFVGTFSTGHLLKTSVKGIRAQFVAGAGPAINVSKASTGKVQDLDIEAEIYGAASQGILVDGERVNIRARIVDPVSACIQFQSGSGHAVMGSYLKGGTYGIIGKNAASVRVMNNHCLSQSQYGVYAFDTSTVKSILNFIETPGIGYIGKDGGATLENYEVLVGGINLPVGDINAVGGYKETIDGWALDNVPANQAAVELVRPQGRVRAVAPGSIIGVIASLDLAQVWTAGSVTVEVFTSTINTTTGVRTDIATGLTAVISTADRAFKVTTQAKDLDTFAAGDEIWAKVSSSAGWTPTTADLKVSIQVEW